MLNKFEETKRKQRFGLRKLKVGVASVLLGFTIFGFNLASQQVTSVHADVVAKDAVSASGSSSETNDGGASSEVTEASTATTDGDASAASENNNKTNNTAAVKNTPTETKTSTSDLTPTEVTDENKVITVADPMHQDLIDNGGDASWVSKNTTGLPIHYRDVNSIVYKIIDRRKDLYFFEGLVDYNEEHNHIIILLALDRNSALAGYDQRDVYGFIIHTGDIGENSMRENVESVVVTPGQTYKSYYKHTDNPIQIINYGENVGISLRDGKTDKEMTLVPGPNQIYGFVPAYDEGKNNTLGILTGWEDDHDALIGHGLYADWAYNHSLATWETPIPKLTSMTIRYVDQTTGQQIAAPKTITGFTYQGFEVTGLEAPTIDGYTLTSNPIQDGSFEGQITNYEVGKTYPLYFSNNVVVQQTVLNQAGDVLARAYFNGLPIPGASKVLKHGSSDYLEIIYDGTPHYYQNKIGTVQQNLTYLYQADQMEQQSKVRVHYRDVTAAIEKYGSTVAFVPDDGTDVKVVTLDGKLGENYQNSVQVPGYAVMQSDDAAWAGTYSTDVHDVYVYLSSRLVDRYQPVTQEITVPTGTVMNAMTAAKGIANQDQLSQAGATYTWIGKVVTGDQGDSATTKVNFAYPDGSLEEVVPVDAKAAGEYEAKLLVTYQDGTFETATVKVNVTGANYPSLPSKTNVTNPKHLTDEEKQALQATLAKYYGETIYDKYDYWEAGPVGDDGSVTLSHWTKEFFKDPVKDTELTVPGEWLVQKKSMADGFVPVPPAEKLLVDNTTNVQPAEKEQLIEKIKKANPNWPKYIDDNGGTFAVEPSITIASDGTAMIRFKDSSFVTIAGTDLVTTKQQAKNRVVYPQRILVVDTDNLSDDEKALARGRVQAANPMNDEEHPDSEVKNYQNTDDGIRLVYMDGTVSETVKFSDLVRNAIKYPKDKILVQDFSADQPTLTQTERERVLATVAQLNKDYFPADAFEDNKSLVDVTIEADKLGTLGLKVVYHELVTTDQGTEEQERQTVWIPLDRLTFGLAQPSEKVSYRKEVGMADLPAEVKSQILANLKAANPDYASASPDYSLDAATFNYDLAHETVTITLPDNQGEKQFKLTDLAIGYVVEIPATATMAQNGTVTPADQLVTVIDDQGNHVDLIGKVTWTKEPVLSGEAGTTTTGTIEVALPGLDPITGEVTVTITAGQTNEQAYTPNGGTITVEPGTEIKAGKALTSEQIKTVVTNPEDLPIATENPYTWTKDVTTDEGGVTKQTHVTIHYSDGTSESFLVTVKISKISDKVDPITPTKKTLVDDPSNLTDAEKGKVKKAIEDANQKDGQSTLPADAAITIGNDGTATITYGDGSQDTIKGTDLVVQSEAGKTTPVTPTKKTLVDNPDDLTDAEKGKVKENITKANKDESGKSTLPDGTTVDVDDQGKATITYPDKSTDTILAADLVEGKKTTEKVLAKLEIDAPSKHYDGKTTTITVKLIDEKTGDVLILTPSDGDLAFYQISGDGKVPNNIFMFLAAAPTAALGSSPIWVPLSEMPVNPGHYIIMISEKGKQGLEKKYGNKYQIENPNVEDDFYIVSLTDSNNPTVPDKPVKVDDDQHLSNGEKEQVKDNVEKANEDATGKSKLPDGTTVTVDDQGTATITYPDKSTDTIPGKDLVEGKTDAEKTEPAVPGDKTKVDDPTNLTDGEKDQVKDNVEKTNPGTTVTVDNDGTATVTYPDKSTDTIPGKDLVTGKTDAEKTQPTVPGDKTKVDDPSNLTDGEKDQVKDNVEKVNSGTTVTVNNDGTAKITYPDKSTDTIPGKDLVAGKPDAEKTPPTVPEDKTKVDDPTNLTAGEKDQVKDNVGKANPETTVTVANDGTATITYPDGSKATISGDQLVKGKTDAEKATPNLPTTKTPVQDPSHLTPAEQAAVQANVAKANAGAVVTVDAQGNATLTYPDGSQLTLKADQLVKAAVNATVAPSPSAATPAPTPAATPVQAAALPQTGDANATALALSGLTLALIGLIGAKKKRSEEN